VKERDWVADQPQQHPNIETLYFFHRPVLVKLLRLAFSTVALQRRRSAAVSKTSCSKARTSRPTRFRQPLRMGVTLRTAIGLYESSHLPTHLVLKLLTIPHPGPAGSGIQVPREINAAHLRRVDRTRHSGLNRISRNGMKSSRSSVCRTQVANVRGSPSVDNGRSRSTMRYCPR